MLSQHCVTSADVSGMVRGALGKGGCGPAFCRIAALRACLSRHRVCGRWRCFLRHATTVPLRRAARGRTRGNTRRAFFGAVSRQLDAGSGPLPWRMRRIYSALCNLHTVPAESCHDMPTSALPRAPHCACVLARRHRLPHISAAAAASLAFRAVVAVVLRGTSRRWQAYGGRGRNGVARRAGAAGRLHGRRAGGSDRLDIKHANACACSSVSILYDMRRFHRLHYAGCLLLMRVLPTTSVLAWRGGRIFGSAHMGENDAPPLRTPAAPFCAWRKR